MFLKRLELQGFKSFPNRTKVQFNKGVTAIVGPNGSGKSNILDAILWVLGEQSAKTLRGVKMEDIIFSGTENRSPMSYAEVSIVIDNSDKFFNVEYEEVIVTRKAFRSGDSEYLINNKQCRLKDVNELFMDTGIGKDGYSIISQGKVEEIVSTKGTDRKQFFDEAVGIVKYRSKKNEALVNLKKEREHLVQVDILINELELQVEPLERKSKKAKEFLNLEDELRVAEISKFVLDIQEINEEVQLVKKDIAVANLELNKFNHLVEKEEEKSAEIEEKISESEEEKERLNHDISSFEISLNTIEGEIKLVKEQITNLRNEEKRLKDSITKYSMQQTIHESDINNITLSIDSKKIEQHTIEQDLKAFEENYKESLESFGEMDKNKEKLTTSFMEVNRLKNSLTIETLSLKQNLDFKAELIAQKNREFSELKSTQEDKRLKIQVNDKKLSNYDNDFNKVDKDVKELEDKLSFKKSDLKDCEQKEKEYLANYTAIKNRVDFLKSLEDDMEGVGYSVKYILERKQAGVIDMLGNLLTVPKEYLVSIDTTLGGALQNIVVENEQVAKACVEVLAKEKKGRATFLPITAMKSRRLTTDLTKEKGFIGLGVDLIDFDKKYTNIFENLLGNVVIVDDMDSGIAISKKYNQSFRVVTLDGQTFNVGGSISGGSKSTKSNSILARKEEITSGTKDLEVALKKHSDVKEKLAVILGSIEAEESELNTLVQKYNEITFVMKDLRLVNSKLIEDDELQSKELLAIENSLKELKNEHEELLEKINLKNLELAKNEKEHSVLDEEIKSLNQSYEEGQQLKNSYYEELANFKLSLSECTNALNGYYQRIADLKEAINNLEKEKEEHQRDISKCLEDINKKDSLIGEYILKIENINNEKELKRSVLSDVTSNLESLRQLEKNIYKNFEELRNNIFNTEKTKISLTNKEKALEEKSDGLHDYIWNKYNVTYIHAKDYDYIEENIKDPELSKREKVLKAKIRDLGPIDVTSIEEYIKVKERYDFNVTQRDDIIKAEGDILKLIDDLTKEMEDKFNTQFAIIRENFSYVFKEMFGGGEAQLVLTDKDNVLESNIEIKAQPPGKKLNHMSLLSGGEKALTAISLLFAILRMKPTPFCILDEVESALDEANVIKYGEYLHKFTEHTQFIAITHRNGTMESSDTMYGVTMQEKGVSTLVSVEFN